LWQQCRAILVRPVSLLIFERQRGGAHPDHGLERWRSTVNCQPEDVAELLDQEWGGALAELWAEGNFGRRVNASAAARRT
jgi:hypothetical protein